MNIYIRRDRDIYIRTHIFTFISVYIYIQYVYYMYICNMIIVIILIIIIIMRTIKIARTTIIRRRSRRTSACSVHPAKGPCGDR